VFIPYLDEARLHGAAPDVEPQFLENVATLARAQLELGAG
jgi:hypothetical protein